MALLSLAAGVTVYSEENSFDIEATGNTMDLIECWENDDKAHTKVIIYLANNPGRMLTDLENGYFGEDISAIKFIFPTPTQSNNKWVNSLSANQQEEGCDDGFYSKCTYNLEDLDINGKEVLALINREIAADGIDAGKIFLAGHAQGGRMVYNVAFG